MASSTSAFEEIDLAALKVRKILILFLIYWKMFGLKDPAGIFDLLEVVGNG